MLSRTLFLVSMLLTLTPVLQAQVRVSVPPGRHLNRDKLTATVTNATGDAVTICVESGQISTDKDVQISTPVPFSIEKRPPEGWKLAMVMPDVGGSHVAVVLDSTKSLEYPFWPPFGSELRLRMRYWIGARPEMDCAHPPTDLRWAKPVVVQLWGVLE